MRLASSRAPATLFLALILGLAAPGFAGPTSPGDPGPLASSTARASGDIAFVLASAGPAHVDPKLGNMKRELLRAFGRRFSRFELLDRVTRNLEVAKETRFRLPGGGAMVLTYNGREGAYLRLRLKLPSWSGRVRVKNGKRFFQAGRKRKAGILVIAIRAQAR